MLRWQWVHEELWEMVAEGDEGDDPRMGCVLMPQVELAHQSDFNVGSYFVSEDFENVTLGLS